MECLTGFATGEKARKMSLMSDKEILRLSLKLIDSIFGSEEESSPASKLFVDYHVYHWGKEEFVKGAYSFARKANSFLNRKSLTEGVSDTLFFVGEAASTTANGTVEGALRTAQEVADKILSQRKEKFVSKI